MAASQATFTNLNSSRQMTTAESDGRTIASYNLRAPTEDDVRAALLRVFGAERGEQLWTDACREAGAPPGRVRSGDQFQQVIRRLSAQGGAVATVALSVEIRLKSYARLAERAALSSRGAGQ